MHANSRASYTTSLIETAVPCEQQKPHIGHWSLMFQRDFKISRATNAEQQLQSFRLRHQVYCEELGFEPVKSDAVECDHYDLRSAHYLLEHRHDSNLAGTMRMIFCQNGTDSLPVARYFKKQFTDTQLQPAAFSADNICELSRLALASQFRRQQQPHNPALSQLNPLQVRTDNSHYRYLAAGLYLAALEHAFCEGIGHAYAIVAPALARMLNRIGFHFKQISTPIELNGQRAAYYLDVNKSLDTLGDDYMLLRQVLAAQLTQLGRSANR